MGTFLFLMGRKARAVGMAALLPGLIAALMTDTAFAEKSVVRPYAAGSPAGGIPVWNPGEKFVGVAGGACSGTCPVYELYVFEDGRVIFIGRKHTGKVGRHVKQMDPNVYAELLTTLVRMRVMETDFKRGTCLKGRPMLTVMRNEPDGNSVRMQSLNPGCEKMADVARDIEKQFIDWTEIAPWLASK